MSGAPQRIVIIGAGQAGGQTAYSLRLAGYEGAITLIGDEPAPPYQRPPLSKAYFKGEMEAERLFLKPLEYYAEHNIDLLTGRAAKAIDLAAKQVALEGAAPVAWDKLLIATGARPRKLTLHGADLKGVTELRTLADVDRLKVLAAPGARMVVVGAGYIGLEAAAVGAQLGLKVTVLEAMPQVLSRVAGPEIGAFYTHIHRAIGTDIRLGARLEHFEGEGQVTGVRLAGGEVIPADLVLVGVGVLRDAALGDIKRGEDLDAWSTAICAPAIQKGSRPAMWPGDPWSTTGGRAGWSRFITRSRGARLPLPPCWASPPRF